MLKRAENVRVDHRPGFFTSKAPIVLTVGAKSYESPAKVKQAEFEQLLNDSRRYPTFFGRVGERNYWLFAERWFWDNDNLSAQQVHALLVTREQRNQARINRAQSIVAMAQAPTPTRRGAIPDDVKQYVWTRDQGRCRQCGSNIELQFDHIVPVAYGGSSDLVGV